LLELSGEESLASLFLERPGGLTVTRRDHDTNLGRPAECGTEVRSREIRLASGQGASSGQ
jgi:hypothetical protein